MRDFLMDAPRFPTQESELRARDKSARIMYTSWKDEFGSYGKLATRAVDCWKKIENWTRNEITEIYNSLAPGATERELDLAEQDLGHVLVPALRIIYRLHNGQQLEYDKMVDQRRFLGGAHRDAHRSLFHGLFGGYTFYDQAVNVRFFSLERMLRWTELCKAQGILPPEKKMVVFAASFNFHKIYVVDCETGMVSVSYSTHEPLCHAVPQTTDNSDAMLCWLEYYSEQLASGVFAVKRFTADADSRGISLFPVSGPNCYVQVTRAIRCEASSVYVPELSHPNHHFFTYSIRFSLASLEEQNRTIERPVESVQLQSRHWNILNQEEERVNVVRGDGVIGQYPHLFAGRPPFEYQSCTSIEQDIGFMDGHFTFVNGSLANPSGGHFNVDCPRFKLERPQYVL